MDFFDFITRGDFSRGPRLRLGSLFLVVIYFDIVKDSLLSW